MKTVLTRSASVLCMFIALALAGHGYADNAQEIIGRWEFQQARSGSTIFKTAEGEQNLVAEFRKDGTFTEGTKSGTYRLLGEKVLRLTYMEKGKAEGSVEYHLRLAGDSLTTKTIGRTSFLPETTYVRRK